MHKELLAQSPLLALPLVAMFLFFAVWLVAAVRAMMASREETDAASRMPLEGDLSPEGGPHERP
jgi:hypothetical protein